MRATRMNFIEQRPEGPRSQFASLRVVGQRLDIGRISEGLRVQPTEVVHAGSLLPSGRPAPMDVWTLESGLARSEPMDAQLKRLREALLPGYSFLRALIIKTDVSSFCGVIADGDACVMNLSAGALAMFVELNIALGLSLIFLGSDAEPSTSDLPVSEDGQDGSRTEPPGYSTESSVFVEISGESRDVKAVSARLESELSVAYDSDVTPSSLRLSSPLAATETLDAHLKFLHTALQPHSKLLHSLKGRVEMLIRCDFGTDSDTGGLEISPEGLKECTEMDIPLELHAFLL